MRKTCKHCVLHSEIPGVSINEQGICSFCNFYKADQIIAKEAKKLCNQKMDQLVQRVKKNRNPYDVLILFSGGKDSTGLFHIAKTVYHLNPIACTVVHPLLNQQALKNIETVVSTLHVELIKFYVDEEDFKAIMRYRLLNGQQYGLYEVMGCDVCTFIHTWLPYKFAMEMGIPIVFSGSDPSQTEYPFLLDGDKIKENVEKGDKVFGKIHDLIHDALGDKIQASKLKYSAEEILKYTPPAIVSPFSFLDYDLEKKMALLEDMGFKKEDFNPLITNCNIIPLFSFYSLKMYDCLPFIKVYARELRKNEAPRIIPTNQRWRKSGQKITKEIVHKLLYEFESILRYVIKNKIDQHSISAEQKRELYALAPTYVAMVDEKSWEQMCDHLLMVNYYFDYLNLGNHSFG